MRRISVSVALLAIALVGLLAGRAVHTDAQEVSPEATPTGIPPVLLAWLEGFSAEDPEAFAALYTEDGVFEEVPTGTMARGRDEIAAYMAQIFAGAAESRAEATGGFQAGDRAVMEYTVTVVDQASGRPFTFRGVVIAELEGERLRRTTEYYDVATILGQLGLLGGAATPAAATPAS